MVDHTNKTFAELWPDDAEMTSWVHPYWVTYSPPPPWVNYTICLYVIIMGALGILGNAAVILIFSLSSKLRLPSNSLIVNLAISNFGFAAINGFTLKSVSAYSQRWVWGKAMKIGEDTRINVAFHRGTRVRVQTVTQVSRLDYNETLDLTTFFNHYRMQFISLQYVASPRSYDKVIKLTISVIGVCDMDGFFGGLFGFASISTLACIAVERYVCVVQPCGITSGGSRKRTMMMLAVIWLWSLIWSVPPFFGFGSYRMEGFHTSCTFDYLSRDRGNLLFNGGMYIFGFLFPLGLILFCYAEVIRTVKQVRARMQAHTTTDAGDGKPNKAAESQYKREMAVIKISAVLVLLYLVSWGPYASICFAALLGWRSFLTPIWAEIPVLLAKSSSMFNPFVYAFMYREFRVQLLSYLPCFKCCSGAAEA